MNRGLSWSDSDEDGVDDGMNEQELQRLQRQYRRLCGDRRAYTEDTKNVIRKQRSLIESLQQENREICTNLENTESFQNQIKDDDATKELEDLVISHDEYQTEIVEENHKIHVLDEEVQLLESKIKKQNKEIGGIHQGQALHTATQKKIRVLENRLDKAMGNFNGQLTRNRQLRHAIDHLRQERERFDHLYKKLDKELNECKREMGEVIDEATHNYEQRDEYQSKMMQLQERNQKDQNQHETEMKELERVISHDNKLKEFMNIKSGDRADYKTEEADKRKKRGAGERAIDQDKRLIESYEEAFTRIKEITGEENLENIVDNFIRKEDDNFALFNYVNEMSNEVELLQEQSEQLRSDIKQFGEQDVQMECERGEKLKELEETIRLKKATTSSDEQRLMEINKTLDKLKAGIKVAFEKIGCDRKPVEDLLGGKHEAIQDSNIMIFLGLIEQRTNELLSIQKYSQMKDFEPPDLTEHQLHNITKKHPQGVTITLPPSTGDDFYDDLSSEEDDDQPCTREEIRSRIMKNIGKKDTRRTQAFQGSGGKQKVENKKKSQIT
ncbi:uncharacterized protein LOC141904372 [Tubulanus polymorphus]|uniref:uncharacterized protein LOC141904372 n=1 Tax=Tubulanus polymorphus TaxID=672921 RepID=UPI003DA48B8A